jgi:acyl carrier protein
MNASATEETIRRFLLDELLYDRDLKELGPDEKLLERGLLDSLGILKIVSFCEEQFGITIPDTEVLPDNMDSVRAIAALVERRRGGRPA